ncbi:MAG: transposase [Candidatus Andersenbacteria bacterium]
MSVKKYRTFPEEFKLEALALLERGEKRAGEIERELGITRGLLLKWRDRFQVKQSGTQEGHLEPSDLEAAKVEIRHLRRALAEAEEEREVLKKAVNIFSRKHT